MKNIFCTAIIIFSLLMSPIAAVAQVASGGNFTLEQSVIAGGGGQSSTGGTFSLDGTIGQSLAGDALVGSPFAVTSGFWNFTPSAPAAPTYEADVSPRGTGNGRVTSTDVSVIQGFQLGLGLPYQSNEFQRADCAPLETFGNGRISSIDVSQAQGYQLGFNINFDGHPPLAAGPTEPNPIAEPADSLLSAGKLFDSKSEYNRSSIAAAPREVRVVNTTANVGQNVTVFINVAAAGDESVYGFSLNYDAMKLSNPVVTIGTAGGAVSSNATQAGRIGVSVSYGGGTIAAGNNQNLVRIQFTVAGNAMTGTTALTFGDSPTFRETASASPNVTVLPTSFTDGMLTINAAPPTALASVLGRVQTAQGRGIRNVQLTLTNTTTGEVFAARSSINGVYRFDGIKVGQSYILTVRAKRYKFNPNTQSIILFEELADVDFIASPF